jgi:hypothetical protein
MCLVIVWATRSSIESAPSSIAEITQVTKRESSTVIRRLQQRLTYANITATIALFIALGGTSYAALQLPRNSVGSVQLRSGSVRSSEVKDRSLRTVDLSVAARRALRGQRGPAGPQGPAGTTGAGGAGAVALTYVTAAGTVALGEVTSATATCPPGKRVTGGGVRIDSASDSSVRETYPNINNTAWTARVGNDDTVPPGPAGPFSYTVFAVCVTG